MANFPSSPAKVKDQVQDAQLHKTNNNMKDNAKAASMVLLEQRLVEGLDVALMTKQAHWNLKGPEFIGIHLMLDKFRGKQDGWNDMMAERIVQLGGTAKGTTQAVGERTDLPPYPLDIYAIADHLKALIDRYAQYANSVRQSIDESDDAGDPDTADLFTEVSRGLDKQLWFLEAHTQAPAGNFQTG